MKNVGFLEIMMILMVSVLPFAVLGWVLSLVNRGVKALESIAVSLRELNAQKRG